jgi:two-component system C4-dicarboxylate transport sensor histidine kinase DctB
LKKYDFKIYLIISFIIFGISIIFISDTIIYNQYKIHYKSKLMNNIELKLNRNYSILSSEIDRYEIFAFSIIQSKEFKKDLEKNNINAIHDTLYARLKAEKDIDRIRYIDTNGQEIVNVYKFRESRIGIDAQTLQDKSNRYYFTDTKNLKKNQVWLSPIDLNKEFGKIERPLVPTIRIITPIFLNKIKKGILVINLDMTTILKKLENPLIFTLSLVDKDGEILWHADKTKNLDWSKYLNKPEKLSYLFPNNYKNILENETFKNTQLYSKDIDLENNEKLKLILKINDTVFKNESKEIIITFFESIIPTLAIGIIIIFILIQKINQIKKEHEKEIEIKNIELQQLNNSLFYAVDVEVEKRKEAEKENFQNQKKAAMGDLISIIAHQLKQPLNALSLNKELLIYDLEDGLLTKESINNYSKNVDKSINFMSESIDDLRVFFSPDKTSELFYIKDAIDKSLALIEKNISGEGIFIEKNIDKDLKVLGLITELQQVIINLVTNAKDILIEKQINPAIIKISVYQEKDEAIIEIEDNAGGIPNNLMKKMFKSYFTTKGKKGTGLGLKLSKMIIEDSMQGKISVENSKIGAIFKIKLKNQI